MEIKIERFANNGKGVGTAPDGKTVFVTGGVPGEIVLADVTAERSRFYEAEIRKILTASPDRIEPDCPEQDCCGGCCFRQMAYSAELKAKAGFVSDAFRRIGGFAVNMEPILPSPLTSAYRNKAEFAVGTDKEGRLFAGFYSEKTHRVVPVPNCRLVPEDFLTVSARFLQLLSNNGIRDWDPKTKKGTLRHLILRKSGLTGEIMLIIAAADRFKGDASAADQIREAFPQVSSVILNIQPDPRGPVLGLRNRTLSGKGSIRDRICNVPVEIGPLSFFQVNTPAAENLYRTAAEYAAVQPDEVVLDLYCGMGTIGLSMAAGCGQLIGGEIIPESVSSAERNASAMGLTNTRFLCGDAGKIAQTLIHEGMRPGLIILDPPRKGCSPETLSAILRLHPRRIVMVSCDPATAARDCRTLCSTGYNLPRLRPVDLFPRTKHVETVCCLYHQKNDFISVPYEPRDLNS